MSEAEIRTNHMNMYPEHSRIELFSRVSREGWSVWGNEAKSTSVNIGVS